MSIKTKSPVRIAVAVVERDGQFLIGRREAGTVLSGLWEFPGGKIEPGEAPAAAAARECREETGLAVNVIDEYEPVEHQYDHARVELHFFRCTPSDPQQTPNSRFRWVPAAALVEYEFPAANSALIAQLTHRRASGDR